MRSTKHNVYLAEEIPRFELTENEIIWLKEIWRFTLETGKIPEYKVIRIGILNELEQGFIPSKIDSSLVKNNATEITFLGVLQIAENVDQLLSDANKIISYVKNKLIEDPSAYNFSTFTIGNDLVLDEKYVRIIFSLVCGYGSFWNSAGSNTPEKQFGYNQFTVNDPHTIDFYLNFTDINSTIREYFINQMKYADEANLYKPLRTRSAANKASDFVDLGRIDELKEISQGRFDLSKLIRLCEELNSNHDSNNYYAIALLTRAIIDHIPPVFGVKNFTEVANNYKSENNERSFKKQMSHLDNSLRSVGDTSIHSQIRSSEVLPNMIQIDFRSDLDVLLAELIRLLR